MNEQNVDDIASFEPVERSRRSSKKIIIVTVVVFALLVTVAFIVFLAMSDRKEIEPGKMPGYQNLITPAIVNTDDSVNSLRQQATLSDVSGGSGAGEAYIAREEDEVSHSVLAVLPALPEGVSYEGWLVKPSTQEFVSTGVLLQDENGTYVTFFTSSTDSFNGYNLVVVTRETVVDSFPEAHILEGTLR